MLSAYDGFVACLSFALSIWALRLVFVLVTGLFLGWVRYSLRFVRFVLIGGFGDFGVFGFDGGGFKFGFGGLWFIVVLFLVGLVLVLWVGGCCGFGMIAALMLCVLGGLGTFGWVCWWVC